MLPLLHHGFEFKNFTIGGSVKRRGGVTEMRALRFVPAIFNQRHALIEGDCARRFVSINGEMMATSINP
jgi:hypothetical protein